MKGMANYLIASIDEFERELERDILSKESSKKEIYTKRKASYKRKKNIKV